MIKLLEQALEDLFQATSPFIEAKDIDGLHMSNCYNLISKSIKALDIIIKYYDLSYDAFEFIPYGLNDKQYVSSRGCNVMTKDEYELLKKFFG